MIKRNGKIIASYVHLMDLRYSSPKTWCERDAKVSCNTRSVAD